MAHRAVAHEVMNTSCNFLRWHSNEETENHGRLGKLFGPGLSGLYAPLGPTPFGFATDCRSVHNKAEINGL